MNYELNNCKYLSRNYKGLGSAGNKAKTDIEKIMDSMGLGNAGLRQTTYNNKLAHFFLTLAGVIKSPFSMKQWLESHGCRAMVGTLGIFDYLSDTQTAKNNSSEDMRTIVHAGALSHRKNTFLYRWGEHISSFKVRLYGNGFEIGKAKGADKFELMGFVKSDELIATARGHFGLVWDGASEDGCTGDWGEYLKINNPHKTSLYLRCSLPVIIWKQAALAPFVSKHGIGLCVDSLKELDTILPNITQGQYACMKMNAERIGNLIAQGHFFRTAFEEAVRRLDEKKNIKQA